MRVTIIRAFIFDVRKTPPRGVFFRFVSYFLRFSVFFQIRMSIMRISKAKRTMMGPNNNWAKKERMQLPASMPPAPIMIRELIEVSTT